MSRSRPDVPVGERTLLQRRLEEIAASTGGTTLDLARVLEVPYSNASEWRRGRKDPDMVYLRRIAAAQARLFYAGCKAEAAMTPEEHAVYVAQTDRLFDELVREALDREGEAVPPPAAPAPAADPPVLEQITDPQLKAAVLRLGTLPADQQAHVARIIAARTPAT